MLVIGNSCFYSLFTIGEKLMQNLVLYGSLNLKNLLYGKLSLMITIFTSNIPWKSYVLMMKKILIWTHLMQWNNPANIYLLKVNNRNIKKRYEICSLLTVKTPQRCQWHLSGILIVNFENISHLFLVFILLTLNK